MKALILILLCLPALLLAQDFQFRFEPEGIPVEIQGWRPYSPWAGGVSESNPAIVDIDADGDLDIFMGEVNGNISFWKNIGNLQIPNYQFIMSQYSSIYMQESRANPCFRDLDGDGDLDLIVGDIDSHVHYYQNIGNSQNPEYVLITNNLVPPQPPWIVGPELIDIDADGDFDLFGGADQQITFYRNIGTPQEYNFQVVTGNFSNIYIPNGWASPEFVDIDFDGDYDLFIGERYGKIWYYRNDGDSVNYNFTYVTNYFDSIDVGDLASPEFADVDGDGDYDLFVGREANESSWMGDVFFYRNIGTAQSPQFQLETTSYLMIDVGGYYWITKPQVVDINGDIAKDLFIGIGNNLNYFQNVGDSVEAEFQFIEENFQSLDRATPCFLDIDADGDYDLLTGEGVIPGPPSISLYLNEGSPRNPNFVLFDDHFITNPNFEVFIAPFVADIDADGDFDLFISSDEEGQVYFYRNDGNASWPNYVFVTANWQGISYPPYGTWGISFGDLDEDGDLDMLMTGPTAFQVYNIYFYRNQGTPQIPNMVLETQNLLPETYINFPWPLLADIDADSDLDLFVGDNDGGIFFFRNITGDTTAVPLPGTAPARPCKTTLSIGTNPANPITAISYKLQVASVVNLAVYDIAGRKIASLVSGKLSAGDHTVSWDATGNASGVYLVRLETSGSGATPTMLTKKVVVVK